MKKKKLKLLVSKARKSAQRDMRQSLISSLKETAGRLGQVSKKFEKEIEKGSKKLAKKLSEDLKIDKAILVKTAEAMQAAETIKAVETGSPAAPIAPKKTPAVSKAATKPQPVSRTEAKAETKPGVITTEKNSTVA